MALLNPYLSFTDNARQAMEFYTSVFGGELDMNTFEEFGAASGPDGAKIMHARLETPDGFVLMAADTPEGMEHRPGNTVSVSLSGAEGDGLEGYFAGLAEGGTVTMPLEKQVWGDVFGMCTDQFGTSWMVNIAGPAAPA